MKKRKYKMGLTNVVMLTLCSMGTISALLTQRYKRKRRRSRREALGRLNVWARPGMRVVFRAELMPGRSTAERAFRVVKLLPNGRAEIEGISGEHSENEFEFEHYSTSF